jgi:hypothetical protein
VREATIHETRGSLPTPGSFTGSKAPRKHRRRPKPTVPSSACDGNDGRLTNPIFRAHEAPEAGAGKLISRGPTVRNLRGSSYRARTAPWNRRASAIHFVKPRMGLGPYRFPGPATGSSTMEEAVAGRAGDGRRTLSRQELGGKSDRQDRRRPPPILQTSYPANRGSPSNSCSLVLQKVHRVHNAQLRSQSAGGPCLARTSTSTDKALSPATCPTF